MLPDDLTNMGSCTIAITSLEKVFVVCFSSDATPGQCSPQCAAAWNSALRDAQCLTPAGTCDASQKSCVSFEVTSAPLFCVPMSLGMHGSFFACANSSCANNRCVLKSRDACLRLPRGSSRNYIEIPCPIKA
jgi:hypothetical protein